MPSKFMEQFLNTAKTNSTVLKKWSVLLRFSFLICVSSVCYAQQVAQNAPEQTIAKPPASNVKTDKVETIEVVAGKGNQERRNDTASKIVVTQEDIRRFGDSNIGDVLKRLPGVTVSSSGGIRMRGLGSGYTQIMLNGEPAPANFSLDTISPVLIERIEVMRSATAELSTQAIAGAINIVLKKSVSAAQRELKIGFREENKKPGSSIDLQLGDKLGRLSYSIALNANQFEFDRPDFSDAFRRDVNGSTELYTAGNNLGKGQNISFAPRVNWNFDNGDSLTSQSFFKLYDFNVTYSAKLTAVPGPAPLIDRTVQKSYIHDVSMRSNVNWIHKLADSADLNVKIGVSDFQHDYPGTYKLSYAEDGTALLDRKYKLHAGDRSWTLVGKYTAPLVKDHAMAAGWDGAYSIRDDKLTQRESRLTTDSALFSSIIPVNRDESFDANITRFALFVQDEWKVTTLWSIYAGVRWEGIDTRSIGNTFDAVHNRSSVWSPILQTLYKLPDSKNDQVRLGLTRTYKAPEIRSLMPRLFLPDFNSEVNPGYMGNSHLKPELAWGIDTAYEHYLPGSGILSASFYVRRIQDITITKVSEFTGASVNMPGYKTVFINRPENLGIAMTHGIELEAKFPLKSVMKGAPEIDFRSNLSFNWSNVKAVPGPNNRLDAQSPVSANIGLDYKLSAIPLTLGGNFGFQSNGTVRYSSEEEDYTAPKRDLEWYGLWKFDTHTNLRVTVSNVLHQQDFSSRVYVNATSFSTSKGGNPSAVTIRALLEHKF